MRDAPLTAPTVARIPLPSGGWWELETAPRWKHLRGWVDDVAPTPVGGLAERVLMSLTVEWSFPEQVTMESLALRDLADTAAAMDVLRARVLSRLVLEDPARLAEELFVGLATGRVPPQFVEVHLLAQTGWSWQTLLETPVSVVERMALYLAVRRTRETGGNLRMEEAEDGP